MASHDPMTLDVAEALFLHAQSRREERPPVDCEPLAYGRDTPALRILAGLTAAELSEAHELFRRALQELGRRRPTGDGAAITVARHLSAIVLADPTKARRVASEGARLAVAFNYHDALVPFYRADDEYGRSEERRVGKECRDGGS